MSSLLIIIIAYVVFMIFHLLLIIKMSQRKRHNHMEYVRDCASSASNNRPHQSRKIPASR